MSLQEEIQKKRKEIIVDSYPMSIGEMLNLYKDKELDVHPEFQRIFRWDEEQKTNLIESILLGIPIPPIYVAQTISGKWDVIDGQQRLSTILQFAQILLDKDGKLIDPLVLRGTKYVPSLKNAKWDNDDLFPTELRISFKREKLNFTIIRERADSDEAKYELFQRLNTGGTRLSPQELRNCILIMINRDMYEKISKVSEDKHYINCMQFTDLGQEERKDIENVVRFLIYRIINPLDVDKSRNMDAFLTEKLEEIANDKKYDVDHELKTYVKTFKLLDDVLGENAFKKYKKGKFSGQTLISAYEAIVPGVSICLDHWTVKQDELKLKIQNLYSQKEFVEASRPGTRPTDRMVRLIEFSRRWFANENSDT